MVASCAPPTGDLACNPGMCPDWDLNQRPFASQSSAQSTESCQPGLGGRFLLNAGGGIGGWIGRSSVSDTGEVTADATILVPPPQIAIFWGREREVGEQVVSEGHCICDVPAEMEKRRGRA